MKTLKEYLDAPGGRKQMQSDIDEILRWMDFEKIAKVMDFLDWGWVEEDGKDMEGRRLVAKEGYTTYIPTEKDIMLKAKNIIDYTVESALEAEAKGEFERHYEVDSGGFICELDIIDDDMRKNFWGEDVPDDYEHSVDICLKFVLEEAMGKFV